MIRKRNSVENHWHRNSGTGEKTGGGLTKTGRRGDECVELFFGRNQEGEDQE